MPGFADANLMAAAQAAAAAARPTFAQAVAAFRAADIWSRERAASFLLWLARASDEQPDIDQIGPDWYTPASLLVAGEPAKDLAWRKRGVGQSARVIVDAYFDQVAAALDAVPVPTPAPWRFDLMDWYLVKRATADRVTHNRPGTPAADDQVEAPDPPVTMPTPTPAPGPRPVPPFVPPGQFDPLPTLPGPVPPVPPSAPSSATSSSSSSSTSGLVIVALIALAVTIGRRL